MNKKYELPEGYTQVEYIEIQRPETEKQFLLTGFKSFDSITERYRELQENHPFEFNFVTKYIVNEYLLLIPQELVSFLSSEERERLIPYQEPVSIQEHSPIVYRFMDEVYIDKFFETGEFMLSTFSRCKSLEDECRRDDAEGRSVLYGTTDDYVCTMDFAPVSVLLCCTSLSMSNKRPCGEPYEACLKIQNIDAFFQIITNQLIKDGFLVSSAIKGPCNYSDKIIHNTISKELIEPFLNADGGLDFNLFLEFASVVGGTHLYFNKHFSFQHECEYRFVWLLNSSFKEGSYIVKIPEARQFCKKIIYDEDGKSILC